MFIHNKKRIRGFTLIEILIVIAIIGILSAISYTMYQSYLQSSFQSELISKMKELQLEQSSRFATNGTYACNIESFSSFDDGGNTNEYVLNSDKINKRKFTISISSSNCTSSGHNAHYVIEAENQVPDNSKWKVKWQLACGISGNYSCEPELKTGKSILDKIF